MTYLLFVLSCLRYLQNKIQSERVAFQVLCLQTLTGLSSFLSQLLCTCSTLGELCSILYVCPVSRKQDNVGTVFFDLNNEEIIFK